MRPVLQGLPVAHYPAPSPEQTLDVMVDLARRAQMNMDIRLLAERIVGKLHPHDYLSEYVAILNWVRANIRYSRDPRQVEQLKQPEITVQTGTGDCDDMAVLLAALVGQMGGQARFVAASYRGDRRHPDGAAVLKHVWCEAFDPTSGAWVVLDPVPGRKVHDMLSRVDQRVVKMAIN